MQEKCANNSDSITVCTWEHVAIYTYIKNEEKWNKKLDSKNNETLFKGKTLL